MPPKPGDAAVTWVRSIIARKDLTHRLKSAYISELLSSPKWMVTAYRWTDAISSVVYADTVPPLKVEQEVVTITASCQSAKMYVYLTGDDAFVIVEPNAIVSDLCADEMATETKKALKGAVYGIAETN